MKILLKKDVGICLGMGKRGQGAQGCSSWDAWAVALLPTPSSLIPQLLTSRMKRRNLPNSHYYQQSSQEFQVGKRNPRECSCSYKGPSLFLEPRILLPNCGGGQQPCQFCTNLALCLFSCSSLKLFPMPFLFRACNEEMARSPRPYVHGHTLRKAPDLEATQVPKKR